MSKIHLDNNYRDVFHNVFNDSNLVSKIILSYSVNLVKSMMV